MNIPKGYKLVPVEPTQEMIYWVATAAHRGDSGKDIWAEALDYAPTPPQPIYDEAKELEKFSTHWNLEGRIYRDRNTHQWLPTRDTIEGFQMAERVHALWLGWESCAKSVEVGDE